MTEWVGPVAVLLIEAVTITGFLWIVYGRAGRKMPRAVV